MLAFQTDYDEQTGDQVTIILPIFLGILTLKKTNFNSGKTIDEIK